jgi:hypothetical protein
MRPNGAEFFHGDGQTYDEVNIRFFDIFETRLKTILCPLIMGYYFE